MSWEKSSLITDIEHNDEDDGNNSNNLKNLKLIKKKITERNKTQERQAM